MEVSSTRSNTIVEGHARNGIGGLASALTLALAFALFAMILGACSSDATGPSGTGGSTGTGGTGQSCSNVVPCGGNAVGTWTVSSSCLNITGSLDLTFAGLNCPPAAVTGSLQVTGTWTANADGTYQDNTTTTGTEKFSLAPSCLMLSGTTTTCDGIAGPLQGLGFSAVTLHVRRERRVHLHRHRPSGWRAWVAVASGRREAEITRRRVTRSRSTANSPYAYCVAGTKMTWTPQTTSPTTTGTIVFQGSGASGTGGAGAGRPAASVARPAVAAAARRRHRAGRRRRYGWTDGHGRLDGRRRLDRHHAGALRHLRYRQHALRRGVQHGSHSLEQLQWAPLPGQKRGNDDHRWDGREHEDGRTRGGNDPGYRRRCWWLRRLGRPGHVLRHRYVHLLDHLRPVRQGQQPQGGPRGLLRRRKRGSAGLTSRAPNRNP